MAAGDITKALVAKVKVRCGETTEPGHFDQAQTIDWLNEAQRKLCGAGPILVTVGYANSKVNAEFYTLPDDFWKMMYVEYRPAGGSAKEIKPSTFTRKAPGPHVGTPGNYGVWGAADTLGDNLIVLWFDFVFPSDGVNDLWIYYWQMPNPVSVSKDPELNPYWQDFMVDYAEAMARVRLMSYDPGQRTLMDRALSSFERGMQEAKDMYFHQVGSQPLYPIDNAGYTDESE